MATIVVVGGGYAGAMAANRLAGRAEHEVVLVDPQERFVERIRLHELATGTRSDATVAWDSFLSPTVRRVQQAVVAVRPEADEVELADGTVLAYDRLLLATGSGPRTVTTGHHTIAALHAAQVLADALAAALRSATGPVPVRVIGGGLTGVELASELAEEHRTAVQVTLVSRTVTGGLSDRGRRAVRRVLDRLGVTVVSDVSAAPPADIVVDCVGFAAVAPFADTLPVDDRGAFRLRPTLQLDGHDRIFVAGDAGDIDDPAYDHLRMSCAAALSLGAVVADAITGDLVGRRPGPIDIGFLGQCISLGRSAGVVQLVAADDSPRNLVLTGRAGALFKEQVCRQTQRWLREEARKPGSYRVIKGPKRATVPA